jgi:hypothetical protein
MTASPKLTLETFPNLVKKESWVRSAEFEVITPPKRQNPEYEQGQVTIITKKGCSIILTECCGEFDIETDSITSSDRLALAKFLERYGLDLTVD